VRETITLDDDLIARAAKLCAELDRSALISAALEAFIERESARRLARLGGSQPALPLATRRHARAPSG
jgi:Arc/MetJ family transcription regulator